MAAHTFTGTLRSWDRLQGIEIPSDLSVALGIGGHVPVVGTIDGVEFHATLVPLPGAGHRMLLNAATREKAAIDTGDTVEVVLTRDPSNRVPPVPDDFAEAMEIVSARAQFDALPDAKRREQLLWIADAVDHTARARRIARAVARVLSDV